MLVIVKHLTCFQSAFKSKKDFLDFGNRLCLNLTTASSRRQGNNILKDEIIYT
jgi:hypothetical protein